jgi:L-ascorbate metabolism protein UlaG (beta-lactamase superfamily)
MIRAASGVSARMELEEITVRYVGGPTALIEIGGLRLLNDPTFDEPGEYPIGDRALVKHAGPAVPADRLGPVDAVLLSHDQHPDNLDHAGRAYLATAPLVLSTRSARERLGDPVKALPAWESTDLARPGGGGALRVTAVPAQHGPDGSEPLVGEVTGFVLSGPGLPKVYVSGDNAALHVVRAIADRLGPFDVAVLHAGAARTALIDAHLTLTSENAARAADILGATHVVPLHFEHWAHFTEGAEPLTAAFTRAGLAERLHLPSPGQLIELR